LDEAIAQGNQNAIEDEFGDVFFSLINFARFLQVDADAALERTNKKFISRFTAIEKIVSEQNKDIHSLTLTELDNIWNQVKKEEKLAP
jgi:uncharacterized protein YabN with tetrapyrrole methylase and pyrophosphatase domain